MEHLDDQSPGFMGFSFVGIDSFEAYCDFQTDAFQPVAVIHFEPSQTLNLDILLQLPFFAPHNASYLPDFVAMADSSTVVLQP